MHRVIDAHPSGGDKLSGCGIHSPLNWGGRSIGSWHKCINAEMKIIGDA